MKKLGGYILLAFFALILSGLAIFTYQFISAGVRYANSASAEYPTVGVIQEVTQFIEDNQGNWPTSWEELGTSEEIREHVLIRFDVTSEQILAEPGMIHEAIQPASGPWRVHPHGASNLDYLRERIEYMKEQQPSDH